jgi:hypothetical protein
MSTLTLRPKTMDAINGPLEHFKKVEEVKTSTQAIERMIGSYFDLEKDRDLWKANAERRLAELEEREKALKNLEGQLRHTLDLIQQGITNPA